MTKMPKLKDKKVIWAPFPNSSQALAITCRCDEILYHGTRGPGKTDAQIMYFRQFVGLGYGAYWRGVIFDRKYKNLDDIVAKGKKYLIPLGNCKFVSAKSEYKFVWTTGEELLLRHIKSQDDYNDYHGHEYPFIGWNELTKYPTPDLYRMMQSCNRSSFTPMKDSPNKVKPLPPIPLITFSTTNPYGPGKAWVKRKWIDAAAPGEVIREKTKVFDPKTNTTVEIERTLVHIFGSYRENIYLDLIYIANLINDPNPERRKAWADGDWDANVGGAFGECWSDKNILPRFTIPKGWRIDRSLDWGYSKPFSIGWWAMANGEEATLPDGSKFCPPAGSLIRFFEYYGAPPGTLGDNVGLKLGPRTVAKKILAVEANLMANGIIQTKPNPGPADNSIYDKTDRDVDSIAKRMAKDKVYWTKSNKSPGSRVSGYNLGCEMMTLPPDEPGFYVTRDCKAWLALTPTLPLDDTKVDDVDTDAEDHTWDDTRYRILRGRTAQPSDVVITFP